MRRLSVACLVGFAAIFLYAQRGSAPFVALVGLQDPAAGSSPQAQAIVGAVYTGLGRELGVNPIPAAARVAVHPTFEDYHDAGGEVGVLAFIAQDGTIHVNATTPNARRFLVHEAAKAFLRAAFPNANLPLWLQEGIAECVSSGDVDPSANTFRIHTTRTPYGNSNLLAMKRYLQERRRATLADLLTMPDGDFREKLGLNGVCSWAVFYYLFNAPEPGGGEGALRPAVKATLDALNGGAQIRDALAEGFRAAGGEFNLATLDRQIEQYFDRHAGAIPDREAGGFLVRETEHYTIFVDREASNGRETAPEILNRFALGMELIFTKYSEAFRFDGRISQKAIARLYRDEASYHSQGGGPQGSAAYYNPETKELVGFETVLRGASTFNIFCHEGCHQFFDLAFPGFYTSESVPMWFSEGLADCFGASRVGTQRGQTTIFIFCPAQGVALWRVPAVRNMVQGGTQVPLEELVAMDRPQFYGPRAGEYYAEAWSFCHFLWNYPEYDGGDGRYDEVIKRLIRGFAEGLDRDEVYRRAFQRNDRAIPWEQLEQEWEGYIRNWR